ncbi:unnamed protein product [Meganyctiphanes norvegica]|uniref:Uncharacterized protein n=1 Tax=Meganyctiphanes norvegica TaxID=48144 RepID=A0AAV2PKV5_MEGNR
MGALRPLRHSGRVVLLVTNALLVIILTTPQVETNPLKVTAEALDIVDIITSIENQDVQDILGLHDNNTANTDVFADTSDNPITLLPLLNITTTESGLIGSPGSSSIRDEQGLIIDFPTKCPEGQKPDLSGKCRKPFAPNDF